jgi:hypothetical protein
MMNVRALLERELEVEGMTISSKAGHDRHLQEPSQPVV